MSASLIIGIIGWAFTGVAGLVFLAFFLEGINWNRLRYGPNYRQILAHREIGRIFSEAQARMTEAAARRNPFKFGNWD